MWNLNEKSKSMLQKLHCTKGDQILHGTRPIPSQESNDNLLSVNVDPITGTTNFGRISCTRHVTIGCISLGAWAVNCIVAV